MRDPFCPRHERHTDTVVIDPQKAVGTAYDCLRHDRLHLLRHDTDVERTLAPVAEAIEANSIGQACKTHNRFLQSDVRAMETAAAAAAAAISRLFQRTIWISMDSQWEISVTTYEPTGPPVALGTKFPWRARF